MFIELLFVEPTIVWFSMKSERKITKIQLNNKKKVTSWQTTFEMEGLRSGMLILLSLA